MSYQSYYAHGRRHKNSTRYLVLLAVLVMIAGALIFIGIKQIERHPDWTKPVAQYYGRAASWVADRKKNYSQKAAAVRKNIEVGDDPDRTVNFEFYNTLQEMQSMQAQEETKVEHENKKIVAVKTPTKKTVTISQATDIEKDLLTAMKQSSGGK